MNKIYNRSDIEIKARELLAPMRTSCPDKVWDELSGHLNELYIKRRDKWTNKTTKALYFGLAGIALIAFIVWKFSGGTGNNRLDSKTTNATMFQKPAKTSATPEKTNNTQANKPSSLLAVADSIHSNTAFTQNNIPASAKTITPQKMQTTSVNTFLAKQTVLKGKNNTLASGKATAGNSQTDTAVPLSANEGENNLIKDSLRNGATTKRVFHDSLNVTANDSANKIDL